MKSLNKDFWASVIGLAVASLFTMASFYKTDPEVYLFPRIIAIFLVFLALIQCALAYKRFSSTDASRQVTIAWKGLFPGLAVTVIYVLVLETIGFYVSAFFAFLLIVSVYGKRAVMHKKALILKCGFGLILVCVLYFLFWSLLNVRTPTGWLL